MKEKHLSIVIPVYNAMPFLRELIASIYSQDYPEENYEVVLVDDGSTDSSGEYCDSIAVEHANCKVIHQENSGSPSGPRNKGVRAASGEYVFFADADDEFYPDVFQYMMNHAMEHRCDVGVFKVDASEHGWDYQGLFDKSQLDCTVENSLIMESLGPYKLFRRSLIIDNNILFPEGVAYEDLSFCVECYLNASSIIIISDRDYYCYRERENDHLSLASMDDGSLFGSPKGKLAGIGNYLKVVSRYKTVQECPYVYLRAFKYGIRNAEKFARNPSKYLGYYSELVDMLLPYYCDEIRSLMPFSLLTKVDALVQCGPERFLMLVETWPDGPAVSFGQHGDGRTTYAAYAETGELLISDNLPIRGVEPGTRKLDNPHINRNTLTTAALSEGKCSFAGHMELLRKCVTPFDHAVLRAAVSPDDEGVAVPVDVSNVDFAVVYQSVGHCSFDWCADISIDRLCDLATSHKSKHTIHFYLDMVFGDDVFVNRFGHKRTPVAAAFREADPVIGGGITFIPIETKAKNFSLRFYAADTLDSLIEGVSAVPRISSLSWEEGDVLAVEGTASHPLICSKDFSCAAYLKNDRGDRIDLDLQLSNEILHGTTFAWSFRFSVRQAHPGCAGVYRFVFERRSGGGISQAESFGKRRPKGTLARFACRFVSTEGGLWLPGEIGDGMLGFYWMGEQEIKASANPSIMALSWDAEGVLRMSGTAKHLLAGFEEFEPRMFLVGPQGTIDMGLEVVGRSLGALEWKVSFPVARALRSRKGKWLMMFATIFEGRESREPFGQKRPEGTFAIFRDFEVGSGITQFENQDRVLGFQVGRVRRRGLFRF